MNKKIDEYIIKIMQYILISLWILSIIILFSSDVQEYFKASSSVMWAFGGYFGLLYIPMIKSCVVILKKIL